MGWVRMGQVVLGQVMVYLQVNNWTKLLKTIFLLNYHHHLTCLVCHNKKIHFKMTSLLYELHKLSVPIVGINLIMLTTNTKVAFNESK